MKLNIENIKMEKILINWHRWLYRIYSYRNAGRQKFAHPYSSWGCGLNENTNSLIRQFFRKGSRFEDITDMLDSVRCILNRRPRKTLNFTTSQEALFGMFFGVNCVFQG
jgi:IS30 family transposase